MADVLDDAEVARVLSITAHPDDVDFGAAGTMARWTEAGIEVIYCVVTDGDAGGFDESFPRDEMPTLRRAEQVAAAKCVGVAHVRFPGYPACPVLVSPGPPRTRCPPCAGPSGSPRPSASACTTFASSATRTAGSKPPWTCAGI